MPAPQPIVPASPIASRFAGLRPRQAMLVLGLLLALILAGLIRDQPRVGPTTSPVKISGSARPTDLAGDDILLYRVIVDQLREGRPYYPAATRLLRENDYPLRPFVAVRLPTLATALAAIPDWLGTALLALLGAGTIFAWTLRLAASGVGEAVVRTGSLLLLAGCLTIAAPKLTVFHESWAALLVALSLALHRPGRWGASVALALAAVLIRELALPYLLLMGAAALTRRTWIEAGAWAGAVLLFAATLACHAVAVWAVVLPDDPASPGWLAAGGWQFVIAALRAASILGYLPAPLAALLVPLALIGWLSRRDASCTLAGLFIAGFMLIMTVLGRPGNFYWAAMIVPILLAGLAFAPGALRDLVGAVLGAHREGPTVRQEAMASMPRSCHNKP
ncbi:hypothetical protein [Sphingobium nicotianae]|uniref:Uncharacterized protein n=1 Tax=Sphingobium nicotianae TaxID=2782607 RepID=A0A9X1DAX1_9SPHN|nr:hypothetical protein [Sphingobium nicotianae]MBT2186662.1 hypothetical protein [Sphingobium nicotianae]